MKQTEKQVADLILANMYKRNELEHITGMEKVMSNHPAVMEVFANNPKALIEIIEATKGDKDKMHVYKAPYTRGSVTISMTRKLTVGETTLVDGNGNDVNLPAPVFGSLEIASDYTRVVSAFLPQDGSVLLKSFGRTSDGQGLILTYKNVADTINETVTLRATNKGCVYTNLLQGLVSSAFVIKAPSLIIKDALKNNQFGIAIGTFYGSMFTFNTNDSINPDEQKKEYLSNDTVRILTNSFEINPEDTLVFSIIPPTLVLVNESNEGSSFVLDVVCPLENIHRVAS